MYRCCELAHRSSRILPYSCRLHDTPVDETNNLLTTKRLDGDDFGISDAKNALCPSSRHIRLSLSSLAFRSKERERLPERDFSS